VRGTEVVRGDGEMNPNDDGFLTGRNEKWCFYETTLQLRKDAESVNKDVSLM
jgi:hypothetical protein